MAVVLAYPPFWVAVGEALAAAAPYILGTAAVGGAVVVANEMSKANEEAEARDQPIADTVTCANCAQNPCAHLACGNPASQYRGGAHGCIGDASTKMGPPGSLHSHHMPADSYSSLPRPVGPSIQMDRADHYQTASYGGARCTARATRRSAPPWPTVRRCRRS